MLIYDPLYAFWLFTKESAFWILIGFLFAGIIHVLVNRNAIIKHLAGMGLKPILKATAVGIPMPLCSCGVIPVGISLYRTGARLSSTLSFLISTPETR